MDVLSPSLSSELFDELTLLLDAGGVGGGIMSPSVYETAQVLRYSPPKNPAPALHWLLGQQRRDGGWDESPLPLYRIVPTLAAILALHQHDPDGKHEQAVAAGLTYLNALPATYLKPLPNIIPVAFELIAPRLLADAQRAGLPITGEPFAGVVAAGEKRRKRMAMMPAPESNSPLYASWEAWGQHPAAHDVTEAGGVGHSAAATSYWLKAGAGCDELVEARKVARRYLANASAAIGLGIPGVMPSAWPVNRFEQSFMLHILLLGELLHHPRLQSIVTRQLDDLQAALTPAGIGFSDHFMPDGDDTAAALAVLNLAGRRVSPKALTAFQHDAHFSTYPFELHNSITVTARATQALAISGVSVRQWRKAIVDAQHDNGWWVGDKWNVSRLYSTCIALSALHNAGYDSAKEAARKAILNSQQPSGGWGEGQNVTQVETAFALLALRLLERDGFVDPITHHALMRGNRWLAHAVEHGQICTIPVWICKDLFSPARIDRTFVLTALLAPQRAVRPAPASGDRANRISRRSAAR